MLPGMLLVVLLVAAFSLLALWQLAAVNSGASRLQFYLQRLAAEERERSHMMESRHQIGLVQKVAETLIDGGTRTAQGAHQEIADASFDVLESIPATRETAKVVRSVHDTAANLAYGTVSAINKKSGKGLRKLIKATGSAKANNAKKLDGEAEPDND